MALVKCPECGKENISDAAPVCPSCGYGIKEHFEKVKEKKALAEKQQKELETIQKNYKNRLSEIDNMPQPNKPSWAEVSTGKNNWIFYLFLTLTILSICLILYTWTWGGFDDSLGLFILAIPSGIITYAGYKEISASYKMELSKYNDWNGYKEKLKMEANEYYEFQINYLKEKNDPVIQTQIASPPIYYGLKCPVCGSSNVKRISNTSRAISVELLGLASSKIAKQYECKSCKHKW